MKEIQDNGISMAEAKKGASAAISVDAITYGRQIKENDMLLVFMNDENERALRYKFPDMLSDEEMGLLDETSAAKSASRASR